MEKVTENARRFLIFILACLVLDLAVQARYSFCGSYECSLMSVAQSDPDLRIAETAMSAAYMKTGWIECALIGAVIVAGLIINGILTARVKELTQRRNHGLRLSRKAAEYSVVDKRDLVVLWIVVLLLEVGRFCYRGDKYLERIPFVIAGMIVLVAYFALLPKFLGIEKLNLGQIERTARDRRSERQRKRGRRSRRRPRGIWNWIFPGYTGFDGPADWETGGSQGTTRFDPCFHDDGRDLPSGGTRTSNGTNEPDDPTGNGDTKIESGLPRLLQQFDGDRISFR